MAVYTSYYGSRELPEDAVRVQISVSKPRGFAVDESILDLSPDSSTLWAYKDRRINDAEYTRRFYAKIDGKEAEILSKLDDIQKRHPGKDVVLLCWEKPGEFCHRRLFADWAKEHLSLDIREFKQRTEGNSIKEGALKQGGPVMDDLFERPKYDLESREGLMDYIHKAYSVAIPTSEVIRGEFAKDFAGTAKWTRAIDFPGVTDFGFCGVRYIDFKDCTNVHLIRTDGESVAMEDLKDEQLRAVFEGIEAYCQKPVFGQTGEIRYYDGNVPIRSDVVFVFGSNPVGINGNPERGTGGAALVAHNVFGVAQGEKMNNCMSQSGHAYGLVTVKFPGSRRSLTLEQISSNFQRMFDEAGRHPDKLFCVAYRHIDKPSLCGYTGEEMMSAIKDLKVPENVVFSKEWAHRLNEIRNERSTGRKW